MSTMQSQTENRRPPLADPRRRVWTREEYHRLAGEGWFRNEKVELVGGEVIVLNPQRADHFACLDRAAELLEKAYGTSYWVRRQGPLACSNVSEPEPDVSVVKGKRSDFSEHPSTAVLVVEVSRTTLEYDRREKGSLYAAAGIPEYWIIDLEDRVVEVYRDPVAASDAPFGHRYDTMRRFEPDEFVAPIERPDAGISVAELVGRSERG